MFLRSNVRQVALAVLAMAALLPMNAAAQERLWFDVNFGVAFPTDKEFSTSSTRTIFAEPADFSVHYEARKGFIFDVGAGFMFTPQIGAGVSVSSSKHKGTPFLSARIPHPFLFDRHGSATAEGDTDLERTETSLHLQAMFVVYESDISRIRVFGGPTYIRVENETVENFIYTQQFTTVPPTNNITITDYSINACECTGWGFHVGGDYSYFFTPNVGVGGIARFSRAKVEPVDYSGAFDLDAGGFSVGGGLRVKF